MDDPVKERIVSIEDPHNEITRKAAAILALVEDELGDDLKYIVIVTDPAANAQGIGGSGYASADEISEDLLLAALGAASPETRREVLNLIRSDRRDH